MAINLDDPKSIFNTMTWKPLYDGTSMEEAVEAVGRSLMEADRQKEEWLANHKDQQLVQSSEVPDEKASDPVAHGIVDEDSEVCSK